jgi:hypothetical protein
MYSINTVKIESDCLEIQFEFNSVLIGRKILELSFNEDKTPTFVESGYSYLKVELEDFIKCIKTNNVGHAFGFDDPNDPEIFDGFEYKSIGRKNYLVTKLTNAKTGAEILVQITDENREGIVSDLNNLVIQIDDIIKNELSFLSHIENPEDIDVEE